MNKKQQIEIREWFKTDREFKTGKQLFIKFGSSMSFKLTLNRGGKTPDNYKFLCYELGKLAGLSEPQYKNILKTPLIKEVSEDVRENSKPDFNSMEPDQLIKSIAIVSLSDLKWPVLQKMFKATGLKVEKKNKANILKALGEFKKQRIVESVPVEVKRSFKLRDEFPFLKQKDCPGILKELVSDMLTTYENYVEGHKQLVEAMDEETIAKLSKEVVEDYLENRQIWDELNYYKKNKEFLGNHPLFDWVTRRNEIQAMPTDQLVKLKDQLQNKIPRTRKKISDDPDHAQTEKRIIRLAEFEQELTEVKRILGITDEE